MDDRGSINQSMMSYHEYKSNKTAQSGKKTPQQQSRAVEIVYDNNLTMRKVEKMEIDLIFKRIASQKSTAMNFLSKQTNLMLQSKIL